MDHHEFTGHPGSPFRRIGEAELLEPHTFRYQGYECAAWWEKVACEPQKVPVRSNGYWVCFGFNGTVVDAYFGALWCGVAVGGYDKGPDVNKPGHYSYQMYDYNVAERLAEGQRFSGGLVLIHLDLDVGVGSDTYEVCEHHWKLGSGICKEACTEPAGTYTHHFLTVEATEVAA